MERDATLDPAPGTRAGALSARVRRAAAGTFIAHSEWRFYRLLP